jgi:hypothetical protein
MPSIPSPFGSDDDSLYDSYDAFVPEHLPEPGVFLENHDPLTGTEHVAFHRVTRELFEERTVYDMTFDYNLARLNLDSRHETAGYRYAIERESEDDAVDAADAARVLRAEFTPTTPFCPQTTALTVGSFRAWNGLSERHEYDLVRVRAAPMHHDSPAINERLAELDETYLETGEVAVHDSGQAGSGSTSGERTVREDTDGLSTRDAPF